MGLVMSSFSVASICGVPLGLLLASNINWHVPFFALAGLSVAILVAAARVLPPLRSHLEKAHDAHPVARLLAVLAEPNHRMAFVFMAVLTFTGFLIFPNLANYMVLNVGLTEKQLPLIYVCGGLLTVFTMNWIGRWADFSGKPKVFILMSWSSVVPILLLTNLPRVPLVEAIGVSTLLMICMSGRFVPAMAMMTGSVEARYRGGFMSMNSSVQQLSCGLAALVSGNLLGQGPHDEITHYPVVGVISVCCALVCIYLARYLKPGERTEGTVEALPAEG
jgi:predicted MFS family arabinose efflux permease